MTKKILLLSVSLFLAIVTYAQKAQRIAYIDMEYILENVPDYQNAVSQLQTKVQKWQDKIAVSQRELEILKTDLSNEKALLTKDLIEEREEDISIKAEELKKTQNKYFGTEGDLFRLRKQLVKPVQDQIYNAIQDIAKKRKYDFVLDKSSDLIMLYTNDKYDISDLVIKSITRSEKQKEIAEKRSKKQQKIKNKQIQVKEPNPELEKKAAEREAKKKELKERVDKQKAERAKKREEQKKAIEKAREKKKKEREEAKRKIAEKRAAEKKAREQQQENNNN
jgi:Skp family chaperone for outer membrane proteins